MIVKYISVFILLSFSGTRSFPQASSFQYAYGTTDYDRSSIATVPTTDGGFIISSSTAISNDYNVYLIKVNASGTHQWSTTFGRAQDDYGSYIVQTTDGGYLIAGHTYSYGSGSGGEVMLLRTDSYGALLWGTYYGGTDFDYAKGVWQTTDGGFIVAGHTASFNPPLYDILLMKTDGNGLLQWSFYYGTALNTDWGFSVCQIAGGGFLVSGYGDVSGSHLLLKTNVNGSLQWTLKYSSVSGSINNFAIQTSDGSFILAGPYNSDIYLLKTNVAGAVQWAKTFGGSGTEMANHVEQCSDGGFILTGDTDSYGSGGDAFLLKTDGNGSLQWMRSYGGTSAEVGYYTKQTGNGSFIMGGDIYSFGAGLADAYLVYTDPYGNSGCNQTSASPAETNLSVTASSYSVTQAAAFTTTTYGSFTTYSVTTTPTQLCVALFAEEFPFSTVYRDYYGVELSWKIKQHIMLPESSVFRIERSRNGKIFEEIGQLYPDSFLLGQQQKSYYFVDSTPYEGIQYYRIRIESHGENYFFSPVSEVTVPQKRAGILYIYPNPVRKDEIPQLVYYLPEPSAIQLSVFDIFGRLVYARKIEKNTSGIHRCKLINNGWGSGTYFINLITGFQQYTASFNVIQ